MKAFEQFRRDLLALSTLNFHRDKTVSQIKIISSAGVRYIKPGIVQSILDDSGDLKSQYPDSAHRVAFANGFQLKQKPTHPLMEYAIHNLFSRLAGDLTPPNELVRFEVDGEIIYPVLISKTVEGMTFKEKGQNLNLDDPIAWAKWSWLLLASILTKPGDGRPSNYIIDSQNGVHCVDNEISFVEPISKQSYRGIQFTCSLFCLFKERGLSRDVLASFCALDSDAILSGWIDDVIKKEGEYLKLFSAEEREKLFQENPNNRFKATILFSEGSLASIKMQFVFLQNQLSQRIQENKDVTPMDLLSFLIDVKNDLKLGTAVSQAYMKASQPMIEDRLKWITSRSDEKSLTSAQSDLATIGKVPKFEQIDHARDYSPGKAKGELVMNTFVLEAGKQSTEKNAFGASFKGLTLDIDPDLTRQKLVLKSLITVFNQTKNKPAAISIQHCHVLDSKNLVHFLHENIRFLDLSDCPKITYYEVEMIQRACPRLKNLILDGCLGITAIQENGWKGRPLLFAELKQFSIKRCSNLKCVHLIAPMGIRIERDDSSDIPIFEIFGISIFTENSKKIPKNVLFVEEKRAPIAPEKLLSNKKLALEAVQNNGDELKNASDELIDDPEIVLAAVSQKGEALAHASKRLRNDKRIVWTAMQEYFTAIVFASEELKDDEEFVLSAVRLNGMALMYVSLKLKNHPAIVLEAIKQNGFAFNLAGKELKNNRNFVLKAVQVCGKALNYASDDFRKDKEIVLAAIGQDPTAIQFAHPDLKMEIVANQVERIV